MGRLARGQHCCSRRLSPDNMLPCLVPNVPHPAPAALSCLLAGFKRPPPKFQAPQPKPSGALPAAGASAGSPTAAGSNPLAGLLGYGAEDGEDESPSASPRAPAATAARGAAAHAGLPPAEQTHPSGPAAGLPMGAAGPGHAAAAAAAALNGAGPKDLDAEVRGYQIVSRLWPAARAARRLAWPKYCVLGPNGP